MIDRLPTSNELCEQVHAKLAATEVERDGLSRGILAMGAANDELRAEVARLTEDAKCAWVNNRILERARQALFDEVTELKAGHAKLFALIDELNQVAHSRGGIEAMHTLDALVAEARRLRKGK